MAGCLAQALAKNTLHVPSPEVLSTQLYITQDQTVTDNNATTGLASMSKQGRRISQLARCKSHPDVGMHSTSLCSLLCLSNRVLLDSCANCFYCKSVCFTLLDIVVT